MTAKPYKNMEGYPDPTAGSLLQAETEQERRLNNLIRVLKYIIGLSGFELVSRIELKDRKSGRIYR